MIRVFPRRMKWTPDDDLAFVGDPPLFRPSDPGELVCVSCCFSADIPEALRLQRSWRRFYNKVLVGGPAFDDPGNEFVAGRFIKQGVTITSRGCPRRCPWCFVWRREGNIRQLPIVPGNIVQDNNLLACSRRHVEAVFDMLQGQRRVVFSGGLAAGLFADWHRVLLERIHFSELWFAADRDGAIPSLRRVARICDGISIEKLRCYVLIGFGGEKLCEAESRLERVYAMGFLPFAQLYSGPSQGLGDGVPQEWKALARKWSRPAAYRQRKKEA